MALHIESNLEWAEKFNSSIRKCHEMMMVADGEKYSKDNLLSEEISME